MLFFVPQKEMVIVEVKTVKVDCLSGTFANLPESYFSKATYFLKKVGISWAFAW